MHAHEALEINIGVSGRGRYLVDGCPVGIGSGTLLRLSPEQAHLLAEETADFGMWVAVARPDQVPGVLPGPGFRAQLDPAETEFFCELCRRAALPGAAGLLNARIRLLFHEAHDRLAQAAEAEAAPLHPAVVRAVRVMKQPIDAPPDVGAIARHAGLGRSQLSRLFRRQTGLSMVAYRQKIQLERFLCLYADGGGRSVTEAALEAGFGSYPQFFRVFEERFGCGPRAYYAKGMDDPPRSR